MVHDLLFAKRGLSLAKEHKVRKKLEKYKPRSVLLFFLIFPFVLPQYRVFPPPPLVHPIRQKTKDVKEWTID